MKLNYMTQNEIFSVRDLTLAAVLLTLKYPVITIDTQIEGYKNQAISYFGFEKTDQILETEKKYWNKQLIVEPMVFMSNLKALKAQTANQYKNPKSGIGTTTKSYNKF